MVIGFTARDRDIQIPKISFEETLKRYQISINRIVSAGYVLNFFSQNEHSIIRNAKHIINGCNENEVRFINKAHKNIGFFEKFFKLFG